MICYVFGLVQDAARRERGVHSAAVRIVGERVTAGQRSRLASPRAGRRTRRRRRRARCRRQPRLHRLQRTSQG